MKEYIKKTMKVLMINGSPRSNGNTAVALEGNEKGLRSQWSGDDDLAHWQQTHSRVCSLSFL